MAAEKTPSRRKQCIFHRAFLRLPFGRCERRGRSSSSSSSSSYVSPPSGEISAQEAWWDVHHVEANQPAAEKWSPKDSHITALSLNQPYPGEAMDSDGGSRTHTSFVEPSGSLNGAHAENVLFDPVLVNGHQSSLGFAPQNSTGHQNMDSLEDSGQQEVDSPYSSVSQIEGEPPPHVAPPPSLSVSSMETDVGVDPETGERAME